MEFYNRVGKMAIGSRLRRLSERLTDQAADVYQLYNIDFQPKWFPVFYMLSQRDGMTITEIASEIGHSHPSVSKIVGEMRKAGLIEGRKDDSDGRRNRVALSAKGEEMKEKVKEQYQDVEQASLRLLSEASHNLWKAMEEWEYLLDQKSLLRRVEEARKERESRDVQVVDYKPQYRDAFRELNEEWIRTYFKLEPSDLKALNHPEEYILDPGGHILVAIGKNGEALGVCALIPMKDTPYQFELAKMAVSPDTRGRGVGYLLGKAALGWARQHGAEKVYLESNTILGPAIRLYEKLGFQKITGYPSPYERCNIQMECVL
ncbi:bifunctional helix-turn-helix transcriptional regulator/GNAT family N-acetyltransferase [Nostoc ellipsosporum NOK]|nr:bifunctional helix-turn-helix transcriptional regulator/GNAT family N-acetyltransferase [Nostoc ellipsosporum NOK]